MISQINYSKEFIEKLLDRLKVGNRRGIHLNALLNSRAKFELESLNDFQDDLATKFLVKLFSQKTVSQSLNFDGINLSDIEEVSKNKLFVLSKKIDNTVYDNIDHVAEFGIDNFALGYPLLIKRDRNDPSKIIKAPLLLWSLNIEKNKRKATEWSITRNEGDPIILNELLRSHVLKDEDVNIGKLSEKYLEDSIIDEKELLEICEAILDQITNHEDNQFNKWKIEKCPSTKKIESISGDNAWIQWSGFFGIYKSRKESIISQTEEILSLADEWADSDLILDNFQTSSVSSVETDPSKEEIVNSLTEKEFKLIQGPPGTGKSQALTAIISNVLSSGGKCLVVCEKKTALNIVYQNLERIDLGNLCAVIDDVNKDRRSVVEKARDFETTRLQVPRVNVRERFDNSYNEFVTLRDKISDRHANLDRAFFGSRSFQDLIALYLRSSNQIKNQNIPEFFDIEFQFESNEYDEVLEYIKGAIDLRSHLEVSHSRTFSIFSENYLSQPYSRSVKDKIQIVIASYTNLYDNISSILHKYEEEKKASRFNIEYLCNPDEIDKLRNAENKLRNSLHNISIKKDIIDDSLRDDNIYDIKNSQKILSIFPGKYKDFSNSVVEMQSDILIINQVVSEFDSIDFKIANDELTINELAKSLIELTEIVNQLKNYLKSVDDCVSKISETCSLIELNDDLNRVPSIEHYDEYDHYVEELNSWGEKIIILNDNPNHFSSIFKSASYENNLPFNIKSILSAFLNGNIDIDQWEDSFNVGYLYMYISKTEVETDIQSVNKGDLDKLAGMYYELMRRQVELILSERDERVEETKNNFESDNYAFNILYNLNRNSKFAKSNSLRQIINKDFELFSAIFPVILINPIAADAVLPMQRGMFDVVIFDEASQLRIEDTFSSLVRGQFKIIAGDKHQMPPSDFFASSAGLPDDEETEESEETNALIQSESLLDYVSKQKEEIVSKSYLDFHYRSEHSDLIQFSNAAFYGSNLVTFPSIQPEDFSPIEFYQVDGVYIPNIKGKKNEHANTNPEEVKAVIKILREQIAEGDESLSIGIATLNIKQRNAIIDAINNERQADGDFHKRLIKAEEMGLFVKNLENIQGDERDIIILSTTFGLDEDGNFSERYGELNKEKGYRLLNVLVTRAKKKLIICSSIPVEKYSNFQADIEIKGNIGKGIFYAYLAYARAVSEKNSSSKEGVLKVVAKNSFDSSRNNNRNLSGELVESPFEAEVFEVLKRYINSEIIYPQYKVGGFRLDFAIISNDKKIAIECDGKAYHASNEAYAHDMYRQKELENLGFIFHRIWSTDWWEDQEREIENLINFVNKEIQDE